MGAFPKILFPFRYLLQIYSQHIMVLLHVHFLLFLLLCFDLSNDQHTLHETSFDKNKSSQKVNKMMSYMDRPEKGAGGKWMVGFSGCFFFAAIKPYFPTFLIPFSYTFLFPLHLLFLLHLSLLFRFTYFKLYVSIRV